jgi:hypothetical protein
MRPRLKPANQRRDAGLAALPGLCAGTAAAARRAPFAEIGSSRRGRARIAQARQLAVYLQHVALGTSLSACARLFRRDRATVRHACARMEDARDDPAFDQSVQRLEAAITAQRRMIGDVADAFTRQSNGEPPWDMIRANTHRPKPTRPPTRRRERLDASCAP